MMQPGGEMDESTQEQRGKRPVWLGHLRLLLLVLAFAGVLFYYETSRPATLSVVPVQGGLPDLPEVEAPTGELLEVFRQARPATLQIEIGSGALAVETFPLGVGTGFFISPSGLVLTAYHVVDPGPTFSGEERLVARSPSGERYPLRLVGFDAFLDLALLQAVGAEDVPYLPLESRDLTVGSRIVAIGNSRNDFLQPRAGIVRALDVAAVAANFANGTVEISAALAPGDSGGPVLSENGEVVGVVSYIAFSQPTSRSSRLLPLLQGQDDSGFAAYAIPVTADSPVVAGLREGVQNDVPVIGFQVGVPGLATNYEPGTGNANLGSRPGVIVGVVAPGGPADRAGLRDAVQRQFSNPDGSFRTAETRADVVVALDGEATPTFENLLTLLRRRRVGDTVELEVQRGSELLRIELELGGQRTVFGS